MAPRLAAALRAEIASRSLLAGSGDRFDLAGAIEAMAATGEGELLTVNGDHETVRMWVDADAAGR